MKLIITLVIFASFTLKLSAQGTTQEEYNYVTNGYAMQIAGGLDMKKGYRLNELKVYDMGTASIDTKALYRENQNVPCAIMLIYRKNGESPSYICIPNREASGAIWSQSWKSITKPSDMNLFALQQINYVVMQLCAIFMAGD